MRTALALGGGTCLRDDINRVPIHFDGVVACNDAGFEYEGDLDAWCSLHPKKFPTWVKRRQVNGYSEVSKFYAHAESKEWGCEKTPYILPDMSGSGSSGLMAAKVALIDLGFDRVIMCGIPMMPISHFFDDHAWKSCHHFRKHWRTISTEYRHRIRSMSGWSRLFFGGPGDWE